MTPRFDDFKEITAKHAGTCMNVRTCGANVYIGDTVGYSRRAGVVCRDCWSKWCYENAEASMLEQSNRY